MTRTNRLILSVLAVLVLAVLVVGIPVGLVLAVGWPFPDPWPSLSGLGDMAAGRAPVPADLIVSILALVMWLLWLQVAWAVVVEVSATVRGRLAGRAPVLPGLQLTMGKLVTTATLLTTTFSVRPVAAGPLPAVAAATQIDEASMAQTPSDSTDGVMSRSSGPAVRAYQTQPGDTWWGIAEEVYGSGPRWKEIRNLNLGRTMDDGSVISVATDMLRPEWRLLLPAGAPAPAPEVAVAASPASTHSIERPEVVVEAGDTVWALAEGDLRELGRDTSNIAVAERVGEIAEINHDELGGDPDLIYPGQRLELPARPALAERAAAVAPDPSDEESASEAVELDGSAEVSSEPDGTDTTRSMSEPADLEVPPDLDEQASPEAASPGTTAAPPLAADQASEDLAADQASEDLAADQASEDLAADQASEDSASPLSAIGDEVITSGSLPSAPLDSSTPQAPVSEASASDDELSALGSLAGARASSPDWIPSSTPDNVPGAGVVPRTERTVPASSARSMVTPDAALPQPTEEPTAELPAVGSGQGIDVTVNGSSGSDELLDTSESRAPIFAGLAAITLVGGYLFRAKGRRRKAVLQSRHPGRRPEPTRRRSRVLTRRLAAAAEPGHPEFVNFGLRALGRLLNDLPPQELPQISGVWVSQNRMVLALADDTPNRPPPAPFVPFADGSGWSLSRSSFDEVRAIARGANGPLPLLTTVGTTTALDLALTTNSRAPAEAYGLASSLLFAVDLEAGRVISVDGRPVEVIETLTMMAIELATSETADQAEIICVGFGHRLATFDRVMVVDDLGAIMSDLEDVTDRAVYASADASPFATRVRDGAADTWNPVIVFHADGDDPEAQELVELAERTDGGVTLVCGYPAESGWRFLVDGDEVHCPDLPGSLANHRFTRPRLGEADDILDLFDDQVGEIDLDDEFWSPLGDDEFAGDPGPARRGRAPVSSDGADIDTTIGSTADRGDSNDLGPSWQPLPAVTVPGRSGGPAGPPLDPDLPPLTLRHSVEHRADVATSQAPPPAPLRPEPTERAEPSDPTGRADASQRTDETPAPSNPIADETPAPHPGGRHLYVVGRAEQPPAGADDQPASHQPASDRTRSDRSDGGSGLDGQVTTVTERPATSDLEPDADQAVSNADQAVSNADQAVTEIPTEPEWALGAAASGSGGPSTVVSEPGVVLRVNVLGNFTIAGHHVGDRSKPWKYTKTPELILYLLLHPGGASQDLLMEQLFPEQPTNRPRLNQLVSDARTKALGLDEHGEYHLPHASPSDPFYKLTTSVSFDLRDFAHHCARARRAESLQVQAREWQAALELVGGRPFTVPHDGYGWAQAEIEATIVKVEEAASALADVATELGDHRLAVWATKKGLLTGTGYYELLVKRGRAALLLEDPEEIVRAFADLQMSLDHTGAPEEGMPDLGAHPDLADVYNDLSDGGRGRDRTT